MSDDIAAVQASATNLIDTIQSETTVNTRFALATYKDFPDDPYGDPSDYPFKVEHVFTTDGDSMKTAINAITVSGGADWEESVYSGLVNTIDATALGSWIVDADVYAKVIILIGDAPPHDPEPFTGYTMSSVTDAANAGGIVIPSDATVMPDSDENMELFTSTLSDNEVNKALNANEFTEYSLTDLGKTISTPILDDSQGIQSLSILSDTSINIYSIVIGYNAEAISSFTQLANNTGGSILTAENAGDVVSAIIETLDEIFEDIGDDDCIPPSSGDWIVTQDCTISVDATINSGNLIVQNNSVLTIDNNSSLDVDLTNYHINVESGSGILIKSGSKIH